MYGPAFLVAPVVEQGATSRTVYVPAGCDWYNYWTNERLHGGETIEVNVPIDTLPLFVRAGRHCACKFRDRHHRSGADNCIRANIREQTPALLCFGMTAQPMDTRKAPDRSRS
jgi:alpha-glucosidase (family GH31 glycosyl hydrolase)